MVQGRIRLLLGPAVVSTRAIAALLVNRSLEIHQSLSMMGHIFYSNDVVALYHTSTYILTYC